MLIFIRTTGRVVIKHIMSLGLISICPKTGATLLADEGGQKYLLYLLYECDIPCNVIFSAKYKDIDRDGFLGVPE